MVSQLEQLSPETNVSGPLFARVNAEQVMPYSRVASSTWTQLQLRGRRTGDNKVLDGSHAAHDTVRSGKFLMAGREKREFTTFCNLLRQRDTRQPAFAYAPV
jgi:hypothetical protein